MGYVPVQRDAGRIMYESAINRADILANTITGISEKMYQRDQENKAFGAKLKSLESLLQTHKDKFGMSEEQVKQFLSQDPNQTPKERYLRIGSFVEDSIKMSQLQKEQEQMKEITARAALLDAQKKELEQKMNAPRTLMSLAELEARYPRDKFDYTGIKNVPDKPGVVDITEMKISGRGPAAPVAPVSVGAGGGTLVMPTGETRVIEPIIQPPTGFMVEGGVSASSRPAPAAPISPAALAPFAPAGRMAPAAGGLMAQVGQQAAPAVSPQTAEAIRAVQPQAAPTRPAAPAPAGPRFVPIPGSPAAQEAEAKRKAEVATYQLSMQNFDTITDAIDKVLPNVNRWSTGYGSLLKLVPKSQANQVANDLKPIFAQNALQALEQLKQSGLTLGQVAIYEIKLLESARLALNQEGTAESFANALKNLRKTTQDSKKRLEILARDRQRGLEVPSEDYFKAGGYWPGVSKEMPAGATGQGEGAGGGNVVRLNVQRGSTAGSSTLQPAEFDFSAYEGKVLQRPDGKRVRIVNGKQVPIQ